MACSICAGEEVDHTPEKTRHQYTEVDGDLRPWPTEKKVEGSAQEDLPPVHRLVNLLVGKGIISPAESLLVIADRVTLPSPPQKGPGDE